MSALLVRGAAFVWTGERVVSDVDLLCVDGRVVEIGPGVAAPPGAAVLDAAGCAVIPGLVNAHHHLLQSAFRTLPGTRGVPMRDWLGVMNAAYRAVGVDPELCGAAAAVGLAEALLCGVTTVADHHLTWPAGADHAGMAEAVFGAAGALGARLVFVRGTAGDDPDVAASAADALAALLPPASLAVGPAGVHSDGRATFDALREVAVRHGLPRRTQANEQVDVVVAAERYGRRPLELLEEWGWLEEGVTIAHLCAVTDAEIARVAASGATVTHAPGCDLPMGWGLAPAGALLDAGAVVGLGTSGGGSNDAGHLLADARLALQASPLSGRPLTAVEVLTMATRGGALGLARSELGSLEPGAAADLNVYDLSGVADAGIGDPLPALLWTSPGRRPRDVVVDGSVVVRCGALVDTDERALASSLHDLLTARRSAA
ncbi:8-oxoguanine deaminase [Baekduia alba]|uniref:amidohydrolase family protein n=1 Tax=Baekduia alba TaxID=2997333 RepID=UPI002340655B|nr:amidohydrolase family protein [Baekduia alba]WCB94597.1 8-oxoguanine deaminase [Baekduia alba]